MHNRTAGQIAESGTFYNEEILFDYNNPLLSDAQKQQLQGLFNQDGTDQFVAYIGKRNVEGGPRASVMTNSSFRVVLGMEGELQGWDYDVNYQKNNVDSSITYINDFFAPNITTALANATYDVFQYQGVTSEQASGLTGVAMLRADLSTEIFQASASTDTGYSLPTTDGTVTVAVGVERRNMSYDRDADTVFEEGQLLGQGAFGEVRKCLNRSTKAIRAVKIIRSREP